MNNSIIKVFSILTIVSFVCLIPATRLISQEFKIYPKYFLFAKSPNFVPLVDSENEIKETSVANQTKNFNFHDAIFSHFHNKLVHFPIAFWVLSFILSLGQLRWNKFLHTIQILVLAGFVFAIPTIISGIFQEELVETASNESFIEIHEILAFVTTFFSAIWFLFLSKSNLQKFHLIVGTIVFVLILATGMLGGFIAH